MKIGVTPESARYNHKFYYNDLVSKLIFSNGRDPKELAASHCKEIMRRSAIVHIQFTQADALVFEKVLVENLALVTATGGLLSIYAGFSFLTLGEFIFWILRLLITLVCGPE